MLLNSSRFSSYSPYFPEFHWAKAALNVVMICPWVLVTRCWMRMVDGTSGIPSGFITVVFTSPHLSRLAEVCASTTALKKSFRGISARGSFVGDLQLDLDFSGHGSVRIG